MPGGRESDESQIITLFVNKRASRFHHFEDRQPACCESFDQVLPSFLFGRYFRLAHETASLAENNQSQSGFDGKLAKFRIQGFDEWPCGIQSDRRDAIRAG